MMAFTLFDNPLETQFRNTESTLDMLQQDSTRQGDDNSNTMRPGLC